MRALLATVASLIAIVTLNTSVPAITAGRQSDVRLSGAGATFPETLYKKWVVEFQKAKPNVRVDYRAIGSGGGIKSITDKTVAFAGSDAPLNKKELDGVGGADKILELPVAAGGLVPAYNLPEVASPINFTGELLADIYLGKITQWNDPRLAAINSGVQLPDRPIVPAYRSDSSGTTFVWTSYLATQSTAFKETVGVGKQVSWPVGQGAPGNANVATIVSQTPGAVGYVEESFAAMNNIAFGKVKNASGAFVLASPATVSHATAAAFEKPRDDNRLIANIWNSPKADAYPVSALTYLIVYRDLSNLASKAEAQALVDYLRWCLTSGQPMAADLHYAPLYEATRAQVLAALSTLTYKGEPLNHTPAK